MIQDQWIKWEPAKNLSNKYYLESFVSGIDEFKLCLVDLYNEDKKLLVIFDPPGYSFQNTDIQFRQKKLQLLQKYQGQNFIDWTFFKITNSTYAQTLAEGSCGVDKIEDFHHFAFFTRDSILEIIVWGNQKDPTITQLSKYQSDTTRE